jgi:hypothetical protein
MSSIADRIKAAWISFSCPICELENRCRLGDVAMQARVHCRGCHETIRLVDKDASTVAGVRRVKNAVDGFRTALKRLK